MTEYKKKLIEVALPLEAINKACKGDKDRKTGHIRNLHKWFAPMPLPAWRAALFASLMDDPAVQGQDADASRRRDKLFRLLERILPLDTAKTPSAFHAAREAIRNATSAESITVMDPFCGGGSTILEAQRLGFQTIACDLNPIPLLITTVLARYPSLFSDVAPINPEARQQRSLTPSTGSGLFEDARYYSDVVANRAKSELAAFFPMIEVPTDVGTQEATVLSWIWTRTAECPNPACGLTTPLASSFELTRKVRGRGVAQWIEPSIQGTRPDQKVVYYVKAGPGRPPKAPKQGRGATFQCVGCGTVLDARYTRSFAQQQGLGFDLMACVAKLGDGKRVYLSPAPELFGTITAPTAAWTPDLELSTHPQYMGAPRYGMRTVADLFTSRQLRSIGTFARIVRDLREEIESQGEAVLGPRAASYADAIVTVLALCVSKFTQSHNVLVRWKIDSRNGSGKPLPAFDTQTVPCVWDFAENNPFGGSVGDWSKTVVPTAFRAFDYCVPEAPPALVLQKDARSAAEVGSGPLLVATDPPYYDNVPYADLSDVFYPVLRFILKDVHHELFATIRPPRSNELVADYQRFNGRRDEAQAYFLEGFRVVFSRLRDRLRPDTPMTVVYSFKQQETQAGSEIGSTGWEVMLRALLEAGFIVTATWPVRTTLVNRSRDIGSNALASAILIVCRIREGDSRRTSRRDFLSRLRQELPLAVRNLQGSNIAPVDLQQAMIGPGMAVFSEYSEVLDASGAALSVHDALALINTTLDSILAEQEGDFDSDSRWALAWFEQSGFDEGDYGVAETLSKAKNTSVQGLVDAGVLASKGGKVRLLPPGDLPEDWDPRTDSRLTVWEMVHHLIRVLEAGGESAAAELAAKLDSQAETARELAYRLYTVCERKKRAAEALAYNTLVQSWPEITRLARESATWAPEQAALFEGEDA